MDSNRRNPSRSSLFVSADGNLLPGREGEGLHGMVHGPFQGFHGLIDTILSENLTLPRGLLLASAVFQTKGNLEYELKLRILGFRICFIS